MRREEEREERREEEEEREGKGGWEGARLPVCLCFPNRKEQVEPLSWQVPESHMT
jgi:hypothetical protein